MFQSRQHCKTQRLQEGTQAKGGATHPLFKYLQQIKKASDALDNFSRTSTQPQIRKYKVLYLFHKTLFILIYFVSMLCELNSHYN